MAKQRISFLICFAVFFQTDFGSNRFLSGVCLTLSASWAQGTDANDRISEQTNSVLGNYLAGRHAERAKNYSLAARLFSRIDTKEPKTLKIQQRLWQIYAHAAQVATILIYSQSILSYTPVNETFALMQGPLSLVY